MRLRSISACSLRPTPLCYGLCYRVDHFREPVTRTETLHFFESFVDFFYSRKSDLPCIVAITQDEKGSEWPGSSTGSA